MHIYKYMSWSSGNSARAAAAVQQLLGTPNSPEYPLPSGLFSRIPFLQKFPAAYSPEYQ